MGKLPTVFIVLGSRSAPLFAVATGTATSLPAMLGRGDLLAVDDAIRTVLSVVRIGLRCGAGKLLGLRRVNQVPSRKRRHSHSPGFPVSRIVASLLGRRRATPFKKRGAN